MLKVSGGKEVISQTYRCFPFNCNQRTQRSKWTVCYMLGSNDALVNIFKTFTLKHNLKHTYISAISHRSYLNKFDILIWKKPHNW